MNTIPSEQYVNIPTLTNTITSTEEKGLSVIHIRVNTQLELNEIDFYLQVRDICSILRHMSCICSTLCRMSCIFFKENSKVSTKTIKT